MDTVRRLASLVIFLLLLVPLLPAALAHGAGDVSVRVVSADPASRTYAFRCLADPANSYDRDWFIRPDDGVTGDELNIAEFLDRPASQDLTYTFPQDSFYHIGCNIVKPDGNLTRGDLHIDLRPGNTWNPKISVVNASGSTVTLRCDPSSDVTPSWEVLDARTHQVTNLGTMIEVTYTAPTHGLYDFFCTADGNKVPMPVEFIDGRDPYFPNSQGVPVSGDPCTPTTEVCDQQDNDCDAQIDEDNVCSTQTCYSSVQHIPASCTGASITSDTWSGGRAITCGTTTITAWNKADNTFEMYKQSGGSAIQVCIGQTCIKESGYAKSTSFPICTSNTPSQCVPTTEVCDQQDNDCDNQTDEGGVCTSNSTNTTACYARVQNMPLSCIGGTVVEDTYNGCRKVVCASGGNSIQVLACDKPTTASAEYFEMYRQTTAGTPPKVCLGNTCVQSETFLRSGHYPICVQAPPNSTCTPSNGGVEICDQQDNDCDSQIDEGGVCTSNSTNTTACYTSVQSIPASCTGASITSDTWNGGRAITCGTTTITAWNKADNTFEMYKQSGGSTVKICLGSTCIQSNGYAKSDAFPICIGGTNGSGTNTTGTFSINWIEPSEGQLNTPPNSFHLNVQVPADETQIPSTEWEIWDDAQTERVWFAQNTGNLRFHTHTPDGDFEGSLAGATQLAFSTTYKVRVRFKYTNDTFSPWSSRTFTTSAQQTGGLNLWSLASGFQIERVAMGFDKPVHIAFAPPGMYAALPDSQEPYYYVTELYGKVKVVHKDGSIGTYAQDLLNFDPFGSLTGGGQMGTIGLYVDDTTGDLFVGTVYVENEQVKNKVIRFTSSDDGNSHTANQVILSGLPSAPSHQIEQISKGPDGKLYVALGDALNGANAQSDSVLAGRIIRMNLDGSGVETYAKGLRNPFGHDWRPGTSQLFATDNSPNTNDRLLKINQGENYLWGQDGNGYVGKAIDLLNPSPVDVEFNPGNTGFPTELNGRMYVAVAGPIYTEGPTDGKQILEYTLDTAGNIVGERELVKYSGTGLSTPIGMDFGPDGLYFTDIYGESGAFDPPEGAIWRVTPGTGGCINCGEGSFRAGINIVNWYPKYNETTNQLNYLFECNGIAGSGNYKYDFLWGDGSTPVQYSVSNRQNHLYSRASGPFDVTCRARDQGTGQINSATMTIDPRDFVDDGVPGNDY